MSPTGNVAGALWVTVATPQLSLVTGAARDDVAKHWPGSLFTVTFAGQMIAGSSLSETVTVCRQVFEFPWISFTVQVTVVNPTGKVAGALFVTVATPQLSVVAGATNETVAKHWPGSLLTARFDAQLIAGSSLSVTVTV